MSLAQAVGMLAFIAFLFVSSWTSFRLLSLWRQTRQAPELLIAIGLLGTGPLGFGLNVASELLASEESAAIVRLMGSVMVSLACLAFYAFTAVVFRPGVLWARAATGTAAAAFAVLFVVSLQDHFAFGADRIDPAVIPRSAVLAVGWGWMGIECLRYWKLTRRRAALGLADPVVVNRFLLWAVVSIESVVNVMSSTALSIRDGGLGGDFAILLGGTLGLVGSVALLLAFLPPDRYLRWLTNRSVARASAG